MSLNDKDLLDKLISAQFAQEDLKPLSKHAKKSNSTLIFSAVFNKDTKDIELDDYNTSDEILIEGPIVNSILEFY